MNYYSFPRLIFFKKDSATVEFETFKQALLTFIEKEFEIQEKGIVYGPGTYNAPERDNQFIEGYTRPVYFQYTAKSHHKFVVNFYDEESSTGSFEKTWMYSFYSVSFYFIQGDEWTWVWKCWEKLKSFLLANSFYDATFSYTYGTGSLYDHFSSRHDEEAKAFIIEHTTKEEKEKFDVRPYHIEIQHKPYLDLEAILQSHPEKEKVKSIQINHNEIDKWPEALFEFTQLETIHIYHNTISKADERFSLLKQLREINLNENPLVKDEGELQKLKGLIPSGCSIVFY